MANDVFSCPNANHIIEDISLDPTPHVGEDERIWCEVCEEDVDGTYLGQGFDDFETGDTRESVTLIPARDVASDSTSPEPYCHHCHGECTVAGLD